MELQITKDTIEKVKEDIRTNNGSISYIAEKRRVTITEVKEIKKAIAKGIVKEMLNINEKVKIANEEEKQILIENFIKLDDELTEIGENKFVNTYIHEIKTETK